MEVGCDDCQSGLVRRLCPHSGVGRPNGAASSFSLGGPWVDVAAPGTGITSLHPTAPGLTNGGVYGSDGAVQSFNGTSFAAPFVAATAALVRSVHPELTALQVMQRIEATAHAPAQGWNPYVGHGVIDPLAAVTGELAPGERVKVNHQSVSIDPLPTPPTPDNRSRDTALVGAGTVGTLALLTLLASMPLRRVIRRHLPERQKIDP